MFKGDSCLSLRVSYSFLQTFRQSSAFVAPLPALTYAAARWPAGRQQSLAPPLEGPYVSLRLLRVVPAGHRTQFAHLRPTIRAAHAHVRVPPPPLQGRGWRADRTRPGPLQAIIRARRHPRQVPPPLEEAPHRRQHPSPRPSAMSRAIAWYSLGVFKK